MMARLLVPVIMAALLQGCGGGRQSPIPREPRITLEVDNRAFVDMTVYIVDGAQRVRLGTATGLVKTQMTIPSRYRGRTVQFLADPIGSNRTAVSQQIFVQSGDQVRLTIPP